MIVDIVLGLVVLTLAIRVWNLERRIGTMEDHAYPRGSVDRAPR